MNLLTTKETAKILGVTLQRVHALIKDGRLPAQKLGRDLFIRETDLRLVLNRKPGRPSKQESAKSTKPAKAKKAKK